jgi:hypothetical protein
MTAYRFSLDTMDPLPKFGEKVRPPMEPTEAWASKNDWTAAMPSDRAHLAEMEARLEKADAEYYQNLREHLKRVRRVP